MGSKIPENYQEWIECLNTLQKSGMSLSEITELGKGTMQENTMVMQRFVQHLAETESVMINRYMKKIAKNIQEALEDGEYDSLFLGLRRFKCQVNASLFFKQLEFIPQDIKEDLEKQIVGQLSEVWEKWIRNLKAMQEETGDPELEDLLYDIRRMKLFRNEKEYGKLRYDKTGS